MTKDKSFKNNRAISNVNPLIQLAYKLDAQGQRLPPAILQLLLAYSGDILAEIERAMQEVVDAPDEMRELIGNTEIDPSSIDTKVPPCK